MCFPFHCINFSNFPFGKILGKFVDNKYFAESYEVLKTRIVRHSERNKLKTETHKSPVEMKFMAHIIMKFAAYSGLKINLESTPLLIDDVIKTLGKVATTISEVKTKLFSRQPLL